MDKTKSLPSVGLHFSAERVKLQPHFVFGRHCGDPKEEQSAQNWGIRRWCLSSGKKKKKGKVMKAK